MMRQSLHSVPAFMLMLFLTGCDYEIESGSYEGLTIGSTKEQVIEALRGKQVADVLPGVEKSLSARQSNDSDFEELMGQDGICVNTDRGTLPFGFSADDLLSYYARIDVVGQIFPKFRVGTSRKEFSAAVGELLDTTSDVTAFNCVPDVGWVKISAESANPDQVLSRFDVWSYWEPDEYSRADLRFSDGVLSHITYYWRPFEE